MLAYVGVPRLGGSFPLCGPIAQPGLECVTFNHETPVQIRIGPYSGRVVGTILRAFDGGDPLSPPKIARDAGSNPARRMKQSSWFNTIACNTVTQRARWVGPNARVPVIAFSSAEGLSLGILTVLWIL